MESIDAFIGRLPKVELHLHLVGSASVPTVLELAERHPDSTVPRSAAELAAFYEFRDCPTSNACTRQVPGLEAHPLPRMLEEGLFVTLNSDDPPMFGTTLTDEYRRAASVLGLSRSELAGLAANGVRASFLDSGAKQALLAEIDAVASRRVGGERFRGNARLSHDRMIVDICTSDQRCRYPR